MLAPIDDVMTWGESFDHLLECKTGQLMFENFLRTEYSEENLLFWLACEEYKNMSCTTERVGAAKRIYKDFVQVGAPRQTCWEFCTCSTFPVHVHATKTQNGCIIFHLTELLLDNKLDELQSRTTFQREINICTVFALTETWFDPSIPD
ncbi:regulator of G-protein signaling 8-like isoform X1 [Melanotaenia boesemani]|uniref:regulator of G-protein signaling 8-like isoform X1 n=1 Tax=Melanotaenia boesemani TaxID=1250792 RepID=UPI001C0442D7|nr:regulator of G-protein signaling 8-like isoform X1 [Melanotaenia boesemani]